LCVGNAGTIQIARILERRREELEAFAQSIEALCVEYERVKPYFIDRWISTQ
jgi:hypothetical protein